MATYYVDPVNGLDTNAGDSFAAGHPWKTLKKTFAAGDTILVAKSPETAAAGTVTATTGSASVATTNDLTAVCPQYTIIRIGGDDTLYMVRSITASAITLHRPYRGATGSGKGLTYYTGLPTSASQDWYPTSMSGTSASHITIKGGVDTTNPPTQNGFTVLYGAGNTYCLYGTYTFADLSRVATLYWTYPWTATLNDCTLDLCFDFRATQAGLGNGWNRVTGNFVSELGRFSQGIYLYGCVLTLETAEVSAPGWNITGSFISNCIITLRNAQATSTSNPALQITASVFNTYIIDSFFDELAVGGTNIYVYVTGVLNRLVIQNPTFGAGAALALPTGGYSPSGSIAMTNVGGSSTDHRTYIFNSELNKYTLLSYDASVYHTAAPSAKVSLFQSAYPTTIPHYIPCDAGVQKTISVWFRKNSSYGSATLPIMRLRWMTGTAPNLVSNVHDETMADTNDTWLQQSYTVTPSVTGAIVMELIFQSAAAGAIAWYDDIGVA